MDLSIGGRVDAEGDFKVGLPGPTLAGSYRIGELRVVGEAVIVYRDKPLVKKDVSKPVWEGLNDEASLDLSKFFDK